MTDLNASVAGVRIIRSSMADAAEMVIATALGRQGGAFHFVNAYTISLTYSLPELRQILNEATATFPDGKPLTWVGRAKKVSMAQVRGPELFETVLDQGRRRNVKHFFLGSTNETLFQLTEVVKKKYPGIQIVGTYSPPFRQLSPAEIEHQDRLIESTGAHLVWVGLGTPKQDFEVERLASAVPVTAAAVGAAFDFTAGTKRIAPTWVSQAGFEWLFRFISEPRRLWKRYTWGNLMFIVQVFRNWEGDKVH